MLGKPQEGAVVERNRTYFQVEATEWKLFDKVRLSLNQGEATLVGAIGFVPIDTMFQFTPGDMMVGAVRELHLITDMPIIDTVDKTIFITVIGQQGSTVFTIELVGERETVIIPGLGTAAGIAVVVIIVVLVLGGVIGGLAWYLTVGREKIAIWKAVRAADAASNKPSEIPDYVPSADAGDMPLFVDPYGTAAARQSMLQMQQQQLQQASMYGYDTSTTMTTMGGGGGGGGGSIGGGGGDINPVW